MEKKQLCLIGVSGYSMIVPEYPRRLLYTTAISTKGAAKLNKIAKEKPFVFEIKELPIHTYEIFHELGELAVQIEESSSKHFIGLVNVSNLLDVSLFFKQRDYNISSLTFPDTQKVTEKEKERYVVYVATHALNKEATFINLVRELDVVNNTASIKQKYPWLN